jgi:hypothetical protein
MSHISCERRCTPCIHISFTISSKLLSRKRLGHTLLVDTMHTLHSLSKEKQLKLIYPSQRIIHSTKQMRSYIQEQEMTKNPKITESLPFIQIDRHITTHIWDNVPLLYSSNWNLHTFMQHFSASPSS